ncbi:hypothetical protein Ancab_035613 [Ancistrocladus abbreviatus]
MFTLSNLLLFLSFLFFLLSLFYSLVIYKLNSPSKDLTKTYGPPTYPIIGCLISFYRNQRRLLDWYTDMLSESPTQTIVIRRFGAGPIVVTANPANVEYILSTNFSNFPKGKPFTDILGDLLGYGIFNVDGECWVSQRKLASYEFSTKSLREFVVSILEHEVEDRLVPLLDAASEDEETIDLQDVLKRLTYDTICKLSIGIDPCCLDLSRPTPPLLKAFEMAAEISATRAASPIYATWKIKRVLNIGSERKLKEAIKMVHTSVEEIITTRKNQALNHKEGRPVNNSHGGDLLSRLLRAGNSVEAVRDVAMSFIMAGRDTTSAAMTWLFYSLSRHPAIEQKLVDEVSRIPSLFNGACRDHDVYEALKNMKYMHACLCETMRLFPPVAWDSKHAVSDDVLPDGTRVKKGGRVTYFPYGMGRMEALWGENWFKFEPDRWFVEPKEDRDNKRELKVVSSYVFPVFQAGPRSCLGREMALMQMKYVVASILKRFKFEPVCSEPAIFVPLLTAHMAGGFQVRVKKRTS